MAEYNVGWAPSGELVETTTHFFPEAVEMNAEGLKGTPDVTARVEMRDGIPEVVDFRIVAKTNGRAVRTADLGGWQLEGLAINAMRRHSISKPTDDPASWKRSLIFGPHSDEEAVQIAKDLAGARAARGPSVAELEEVANVYRQSVDRNPTESVQTMMGYSSRRTAARRVQQARAAGLLPETTPGKKKA